MTYKFRIGLQPQWVLEGLDPDEPGGGRSLHDLLSLLAAIDATGHIAGACKACGLSYRHGWGVLRRFEALFGTTLIVTRRRQNSGWKRKKPCKPGCCAAHNARHQGPLERRSRHPS